MTVQTISIEMPVGQIVLDYPRTRALFEKLRIDYACSGDLSLRQAAENAGIDPESILLQLEGTLVRDESAAELERMSLTDLCCWLVSTHHARLKQQMPSLDCLLCRVRKSCQKPYSPMLKRIGELFTSLRSDLQLHLSGQEQDVFPLIARLEAACGASHTNKHDQPGPVIAQTGTDVQTAIVAQMRLHSSTAAGLSTIRDLTEDYRWLDRSDEQFVQLYHRLAEFENDLHEHIHLENNLLFPKVARLLDAIK